MNTEITFRIGDIVVIDNNKVLHKIVEFQEYAKGQNLAYCVSLDRRLKVSYPIAFPITSISFPESYAELIRDCSLIAEGLQENIRFVFIDETIEYFVVGMHNCGLIELRCTSKQMYYSGPIFLVPSAYGAKIIY